MKKQKRKKKQQVNLVIPFTILIILIGGVLLTSKSILNEMKTSISINELKDKPLSYGSQSDTIITIYNKKLSDKKILENNDSYNFKISKSKDNQNKNYSIQIIDLSKNIDYKYIKLYLTDAKNNKLENFEKPKKLDELTNTNNGKILYTGTLTKKQQNFKLKVWISENYKEKVNFSYKLLIN